MSKLEQARTALVEAQCQWRMLRQVKRFLPNQPWSPSALLDERLAATPNGLALAYMEHRYTFRDYVELDKRRWRFMFTFNFGWYFGNGDKQRARQEQRRREKAAAAEGFE